MRKTFIVFLSWLLSGTSFAQAYKPDLNGKFLPAQVIFGDGTVHDTQMQYQQPEYFKNPQNKFRLDLGNGPYDHTGGIEAFSIDGNVWALRTIQGKVLREQQFMILRQQGIIEQFEYVVNGKVGEVKDNTEVFIVAGDRTKTVWYNKLKNETVEGHLSLEKLKEWVADDPEVLEDLRKEEEASTQQGKSAPAKGLLGALEKAAAKENEVKYGNAGVDVSRIINNYNFNYESRSPGKVKFYFTSLDAWKNRTKSVTEEKAVNQAQLDDLFAGRPQTASPETASAKDNVPVKKETFRAKMSRITTDGNKIGVYFKLLPARTVQQQTGTVALSNVTEVEGGYMDESLHEAGQQFVGELNRAYNTSHFELIDINQIPYREVKVLGQKTRIDDWWATKYKVVFFYTLDPRLEPVSGSEFTATLNVLQSLVVTEFMGGPANNKQDILAQILNMGGFRTPPYTQGEELKDPKEIYEKTLTKLSMPVLDKIKAERADGLAKIVKRLAP